LKANDVSKLYLVTGVSSGIGFAIAQLLLANEQRVLGVARSCSEKVQSLQNNYPDSFVFESKDLTQKLDKLPRWILGLSKLYGRFSGFVHAAGILQVLPLRFNTHQKMLDIFTLNLFSALELSKGISDKRVSHGDGSSIVFISSIAANSGAAGTVNYGATKASLNGAMKSLAKELASDGIRVNSISPGLLKTEMTKDINNNSFFERMSELYPLGLGEAEDVAEAAFFLLSDRAKWITGTELIVDGGITLGINE
jgi:3-oxoacyl-[acyl-carrier protein] reductase